MMSTPEPLDRATALVSDAIFVSLWRTQTIPTIKLWDTLTNSPDWALALASAVADLAQRGYHLTKESTQSGAAT